MLSKTQHLFAQSILPRETSEGNKLTSGQEPFYTQLNNYSADEAKARLSIYQNNFYRSLIDTLIETFAGIHQLIGNEAFEYLAREFIISHPPANATISLYGKDFAKFLSTQEVSQQLPYIADSAALEWALHAAYYQKDIAPLALEKFLEIDTQKLMQCQFDFHPATQILQSDYAIFSIHDFLNSDNQEKQINSDTPESVLICRQHYTIQHYLIETGTCLFIDHLMHNKNLQQAVSEVMDQQENREQQEFDPSQALSFLIQTQIVIGIRELT